MTSHRSKSADPRPGRASVQSGFEPDTEWIDRTQKQIEGRLQSIVDAARETQSRRLQKTQDPKQRTIIENDLKATMDDIIKFALQQLKKAVDCERQDRRWAADRAVDAGWMTALVKEKQTIPDDIKRKESLQSQGRPDIIANNPRRENKGSIMAPADSKDHGIHIPTASDVVNTTFGSATQQLKGARCDATVGNSVSNQGHTLSQHVAQDRVSQKTQCILIISMTIYHRFGSLAASLRRPIFVGNCRVENLRPICQSRNSMFRHLAHRVLHRNCELSLDTFLPKSYVPSLTLQSLMKSGLTFRPPIRHRSTNGPVCEPYSLSKV